MAITQGTTALAASVSAGQTITTSNLGQGSSTEFQQAHGGKCDPNNDGWHFIINGLSAGDGTTLDATDLPSTISIKFSDGSVVSGAFLKLSGPTAHYLNNSDHQADNVYPTSASLTFPAVTDVTAYTNFVLSHIPCGFPGTTTTTTQPATTTTAAATTTTEAATTTTEAATTTTQAATTTTEAATTTTQAATTTTQAATTTTAAATTTSVESEAPVVTPAAPSTASQVASEAPVLTAPAGSSLPVTGSGDQSTLLIVATILFLGGVILLARSRRPQEG